jgi:hypothetical protein
MRTYPLTRKHDPINKEATNPPTLVIDFSTNTDVTIILFFDNHHSLFRRNHVRNDKTKSMLQKFSAGIRVRRGIAR